jgi:putative endopeptidase
MDENIADLGGLVIALDGYHLSLRGEPAPVIDGYTGDQRFFLAYAQSCRGKLRDEALRDQLVSDFHSPRRFRVDGVVPNIDDALMAWYRTLMNGTRRSTSSLGTSYIFLQIRGFRFGS